MLARSSHHTARADALCQGGLQTRDSNPIFGPSLAATLRSSLTPADSARSPPPRLTVTRLGGDPATRAIRNIANDMRLACRRLLLPNRAACVRRGGIAQSQCEGASDALEIPVDIGFVRDPRQSNYSWVDGFRDSQNGDPNAILSADSPYGRGTLVGRRYRASSTHPIQ
jgi:hypothetical protein